MVEVEVTKGYIKNFHEFTNVLIEDIKKYPKFSIRFDLINGNAFKTSVDDLIEISDKHLKIYFKGNKNFPIKCLLLSSIIGYSFDN